MKTYRATITMLVVAETEDNAFEAVSESMQNVLTEYPECGIVNWEYVKREGFYQYPQFVNMDIEKYEKDDGLPWN